MCAGCGHNAITQRIIRACWENGIPPHMVAKMSGIGCSSKTPAYFLSATQGFNSVHGRMPSVATGAGLANRDLIAIGVSGDGDTASIGLGQFVHALRRNLPLLYIVENNGVYGLTKGQFSATAEKGSKQRKGPENPYEEIDLCALAIQMRCGFVARSYAGAPKQLGKILQSALSYRGMAMIDVISPCVTFFDHEGSYRSYHYVNDHQMVLHDLDYVPHYEEVQPVDIPSGEVRDVLLNDGSTIRISATKDNFDTTDRMAALTALEVARRDNTHLTGILHLNPGQPTFHDILGLTKTPIAHLPDSLLRPPPEALERILDRLS
ncbi:2-oxoacid:ferredoxin oxidoreductase subunit beta [bacterium]|nr:2-oxoacid:ferredoxin oxidoreductase subunit beta [bacterium]